MTPVLSTRIFVNNENVSLNEFAHSYMTKIVICAVSLLKGGQNVEKLSFLLENKAASLTINDRNVPLSPFPHAALIGTFSGMVSSLRGIDKIDKLNIEIKME